MKKFIYTVAVVFFTALVAYEFGNSPFGRMFSARGTLGKLLYLVFCVLSAGALTALLMKKTKIYGLLKEFSFSGEWRRIRERYQIENWHLAVLAVILLGGGILRFAGIDWGITSVFQPDEAKLVWPAAEMADALYPYHAEYGYPNQLVSKLASLLIALHSRITGISPIVAVMDNFVIFRWVVAAFGTAAIITAFLIGNYLQKHLGIILAALVAFFPEYIILSKQVTGDVTAFFFLNCLLLAGFHYQQNPDKKRYVLWMSLMAAAATMEKWHAAVGCFYIAAVIIYSCRKKVSVIFRQGIMALAGYVGGCFLIAPNALWDLKGFISGVVYMYTYDKQETALFLSNFRSYTNIVKQYTGVFFGILCIFGIWYLCKSWKKEYLLVLLGIFKWLAVSMLNRAMPRWTLEFYFIVLFFCALGLYGLLKNRYKLLRLIGGAAGSLTLGCLLAGSVLGMVVAVCSGQDTRLLQQQFCEENGINIDNSIYDYYTAWAPGGTCTTKPEGEWVKLVSSLVEEDSVLYVTVEDKEYAIDNIGEADSEETGHLDENCPILWEDKGISKDIFRRPVTSIEGSRWETILIRNNFRQIKAVLEGGSIGPEIVVYDIRNLPVWKG